MKFLVDLLIAAPEFVILFILCVTALALLAEPETLAQRGERTRLCFLKSKKR